MTWKVGKRLAMYCWHLADDWMKVLLCLLMVLVVNWKPVLRVNLAEKSAPEIPIGVETSRDKEFW